MHQNPGMASPGAGSRHHFSVHKGRVYYLDSLHRSRPFTNRPLTADAPSPLRADQLRDGDRYELRSGHPIYCAPAGRDHAAIIDQFNPENG